MINIKVLLLGLSNKIGLEPFDSSTNSGKLVDMIIKKCNCGDIEFTKYNLVMFAPLDSNNKLRYPNKEELQEGVNELSKIINKYDCIILFGDKVQKAVNKDLRFNNVNKIYALHPSYIWIYKHKEINNYVDGIVGEIMRLK